MGGWIRSGKQIQKKLYLGGYGALFAALRRILIDARQREELVPKIQAALGKLAAVLGGYAQCLIFEAANNVSVGNFYLALKAVGKANKLESTAA